MKEQASNNVVSLTDIKVPDKVERVTYKGTQIRIIHMDGRYKWEITKVMTQPRGGFAKAKATAIKNAKLYIDHNR